MWQTIRCLAVVGFILNPGVVLGDDARVDDT
jgi:hypothetical protein